MLPSASADLLLPLALLGGALLAFAGAAAISARQHALIVTLANGLLSFLVTLTLAAPKAVTLLDSTHLLSGSLTMLAALLIAAPLTDRARSGGLLFAALIGGLFLAQFVRFSLPSLLPVMPHSAALLLIIIAATLLGLIGSALLPTHPSRQRHDGRRTMPLGNPLLLLLGLVLLALSFAGIDTRLRDAEPASGMLIAPLTGALISLLAAHRAHHPQPLRRAGEGLLAGALIALLAPDDLTTSLVCGALAALCVERGEAIAHALRLDDPTHHLGVLLLPALIGLLLPGLLDLHMMADALRWLGALLTGVLLAALFLWPMAMGLFGLAAGARQVREGLDFHA